MKFKVGDKVRAIKSIYKHSKDFKIGEVYTIIRVDEDSIAFPYQLDCHIWCLGEELELVEDDFDKKEEWEISETEFIINMDVYDCLIEYMQNSIDNGHHKFFYDDDMHDFKCVDCINALNIAKELYTEHYKKLQGE